MGAYLHTLRQTFRHVYPVLSVDSWQQLSRSTIVILASDTPLDLEAFQNAAPRSAPQLVSQQEIDAALLPLSHKVKRIQVDLAELERGLDTRFGYASIEYGPHLNHLLYPQRFPSLAPAQRL